MRLFLKLMLSVGVVLSQGTAFARLTLEADIKVAAQNAMESYEVGDELNYEAGSLVQAFAALDGQMNVHMFIPAGDCLVASNSLLLPLGEVESMNDLASGQVTLALVRKGPKSPRTPPGGELTTGDCGAGTVIGLR